MPDTSAPQVTESQVYEALREVFDPEIPVSVVDLGLIYDVKIIDDWVGVKMTLTTPGCGMAGAISNQVRERVPVQIAGPDRIGRHLRIFNRPAYRDSPAVVRAIVYLDHQLFRLPVIRKVRSADDRRAVALTLTALGKKEAGRTGAWSDLGRMGVAGLSPSEQAVFLRGLTKVIHALQEQGVISTVRMCAGCAYFRPYAHADTARPHHCAFVNKAMGEGHLRLECPDFVPVPEVEGAERWRRFVSGNKGR